MGTRESKRRLLAAWVAGVVITFAAGAMWHRAPPALADPAPCAGVGEYLAATGARLAPDLPLATIFKILNIAGLIATLAGLIRLIDRVTGSLGIALAVSVAVVGLPIFTPALEPAPTLAIGAVSWAAIGALRSRAWGALGVAITLAVAPGLTVVCGAGPSSFSIAAIQKAVSVAFAGIGLAPVALAALGAFMWRGRLAAPATWLWIAAAALSLAIAGARGDVSPERVLAPALVAFWVLVAAGLHELVTVRGPINTARRIAALACVLAVPVLTVASRPEWIVPGSPASGHELLSRRDFVRLLNNLEPGTALVDEDAVTTLLLRSAAGLSSVASKSIRTVPRKAEAVAALLSSGVPVAAMPRAQADLQREGFQIDPSRLQVPGQALAALRPGGPCTVVGSAWQAMDGLTAAGTFTLVADGPDSRGPVALYLAGPSTLAPEPVDWPDLARRGFFVSSYDLADSDSHRRFAADLSDNAGPPDARLAASRYVSYLEIWRVPGAPLHLAVRLEHPPALALARTRSGTVEPGLHLCPSFDRPAGRFTSK